MRKKRTPPKPMLVEHLPVEEKIRGADGRPIKLGVIVRRVPHISATLGVMVEQRRGRVVEIFRTVEGGPVTVRFRGSDRDGQALYSGRPEHLKRSAATVEITGSDEG